MRSMIISALLFVLVATGPTVSPRPACADSGVSREKALPTRSATRDFVLDRKYLCLPVCTGAAKTWVKLEVGGKVVREFKIELAGDKDSTGLVAPLDVSAWKGKTAKMTVESLPTDSKGLELVALSDTLPDEATVYREALRPQFHFAPRFGWTNDPNGLVRYDGTYHLFYQHNPFGIHWDNMTWGHATSPDLFHWTHCGDVIHPDPLGTIFSGSAVVDWKNTSGLGTNDRPPLVALFTYNGPSMRYGAKASQGLAWSNDSGATWKKYEGNPVLPHRVGGNRDPKVFWHEPTKTWIMALYMDKQDYALFGSTDLKTWNKTCDIRDLGCTECPDFFELPVDGNASKTKWVYWGANGVYVLGSFDGKTFRKESEPLKIKWGGNDYAAQSYSDTPGRRIQLAWMQGGRYPDMPFNQQFTVPRELTLRTTPDGVRLCMYPVRELESIRTGNKNAFGRITGGTAAAPIELALPKNDLLDVELTLNPMNAKKIQWEIAGRTVVFDVENGLVELGGVKAPLIREDGRIRVRLVLDRTSSELFVAGGRSQIAVCFLPNEKTRSGKSTFVAPDGPIGLVDATVWELGPTWTQK